ncbi:hypothetical protein FM106_32115 [Brachybacterium faecium]|nr:hypothetical protein FM106_32115 [Brachybacterium faecium]
MSITVHSYSISCNVYLYHFKYECIKKTVLLSFNRTVFHYLF